MLEYGGLRFRGVRLMIPRVWSVAELDELEVNRLLSRASLVLDDRSAVEAYRHTPLCRGWVDRLPREVLAARFWPEDLAVVGRRAIGASIGYLFVLDDLAYVAVDGELEAEVVTT